MASTPVDPVRRYMDLARDYHRFEARYFGVTLINGERQPPDKRRHEEAVRTLTRMRAELDEARQAWIESLLAA